LKNKFLFVMNRLRK